MQFQSQSNNSFSSSIGTQCLTPEGQRTLEGVAQRNGFSLDAVLTLLDAVNRGNGNQAQFNHWEFGGMGQWSLGGMVMIGDMFNNNLKYRVSNLCTELSNLLRNQPLYKAPEPIPTHENVSLFVPGSSSSGWPAEFGYASSSGAQNNLSYAFFPDARRLCLRQDGRLRIFNTGDHRISGVGQQQGGDQTLTFTSQLGLVRLLDLPEISTGNDQASYVAPQQPAYSPPPPVYSEPPAPAPQSFPPAAQQGSPSSDDIFNRIERLAELHQKNIISGEEFAAKKAELLSRL
jgi:hypothetical protein